MLIKLQGKYGKSLEGNLKAQKELDDAFGDSSAVVKQLYGNIDSLQRNITELGGSDGLKRTQEMAAKMVKPWDRFVAILNAAQTVIGLTLLPVLYPLLNKLADMGATFVKWMQMFPNIARVVGYVTLAILSVAAAGALANIVMGVSFFVMTGLTGIWKVFTAVTKINTAWLWLNTKASLAWASAMKFARGVILALRMAAISAGIGINLMSWPVLLIIGAIALLVAGCWLLVKNWETIKAAVMNTAAFKVLAEAVDWVAGVFQSAWQTIADGWNSFVALLTGFSPLDSLAGMASGIVGLFDNVWNTIKATFLNSWNWIVEKLNKIPGVDISLAGGNSDQPLTQNTLSTGGNLTGVDKGGISKTINSNTKSVTDQSKHFGTVNIYPTQSITPGQLAEWGELQ